jgi:hypothetical protein
MDRMGKDGPDTAPETRYRIIETRDGGKIQVPEGIDPGWDYNVGQGANILKEG